MKNRLKRRHEPYTKFKAFLEENDIPQKELAELLGKTPTSINQNLNGTGGDLSMKDVRTICKKYGISSDKYFINPKVS
jgi:transcriptional regulator with XRE-family HTH domain